MTVVKLGEICDLVNGKAFKPSDWSASGTPIIRIQNLNGSEKPFNYWSGTLDRQVRVNAGDVLLAWSGTPGTSFGVHIWDRMPAILNQHIFRVDLDRKRIGRRWFKYAVNSRLDQLIAKAHGGVGLQHVTRGMVDELEIPLPPLDEQRRIAAILDEADALRRKRKRAIELLDSLRGSIFRQAFVGDSPKDWPKCSVESLSRDIRTGPFGSQLLHSEFVDEGIAVLGIDNVVANEFQWRERRYVTAEKYAKLRRYTVSPGDVLITIMGTCGRCAIVPDDVPIAINTKHLCCITLENGRCLPEFMHAAFLQHPDVLQQLGVQSKGAVMPGLNMGIIKSLLIPLPPIDLQRKFAEMASSIKRMLDSLREAETGSNILFSSLQHRAFSGQL